MNIFRSTIIVFIIFSLIGCSSLGETFSNKPLSFTSCDIKRKQAGECACTLSNVCYATESKVYAGTREDAFLVALPFAYIGNNSEGARQTIWLLPFLIAMLPLALVDLPLSAVSDTLLYPYHKNQDAKQIERISNEK